MKTYTIPPGALAKAWAYSLRVAQSIGFCRVLVAERDGINGRLIRDRVYRRRPARATCTAVLPQDGPSGWNMRAVLHWSQTH